MTISIDRRTSIASTVAAATVGCAGVSHQQASAIEPIERTKGSHFKYSLAAYSYRDLLKGKSPKHTLNDFINDCAKFGLDGAELTSYYFPPEPSAEYLRGLKAYAFRRGLNVSGTPVGNDFCF